ncbi:MAG: TonB-dependent receptor [Pseudomonadota bacterium]
MGQSVRSRSTKAALFSMASAFILSGPVVAHAQVGGQTASTNIEIDAGPLGDRVLELSETLGVNIFAPGALVAGKSAQALSGSYSTEEALNVMLVGTGLEAIRGPNGGYVLAAAPTGVDQNELQQARTTENKTVQEPLIPDRIIVTGTKKGLSLQETDISVAIYDSEFIEQQVIFDVEDVLLRSANASINGNAGLNGLSIRGVTAIPLASPGSGATSNVYVDGAPNSPDANLSPTNLWDISQVEILRGPQSTIQGRNALAGAVVIDTADPEYQFGANFRALAGNQDQRRYSSMVTGPIVKDQIAFRLAADYREFDAGVVNANTDSRSRFQEALDLRGKLLIEPIQLDGLRIELTASYVDSEAGDFNLVTPSGAIVEPTADGRDAVFIDGAFDDFDPFGDVTFGQAGFGRLDDVEVSRGLLDVRYDLNETWTLVALGTLESTSRSVQLLPSSGSEIDNSVYSAELRAEFNHGALTGWIGGYYFNQDQENVSAFNFNLNALGLPTVPTGSLAVRATESVEKTENAALFADISYEVNEKWELGFGFRVDYEEFSNPGTITSVFTNPADCVFADTSPIAPGLGCSLPLGGDGTNQTDPLEADYSALLPRASITYRIDDKKSLSINIQRGYRAGGGYLFQPEITSPLTNEEFDPEYLTNFELAFRSLWLEDRLRLNANAFFALWDDQQVTIPDPDGIGLGAQILNAGSSEFYGLEVDVAYQVDDELSVFGSLGLLETEYTDFPFAVSPPAPAGNPFENLEGNEFDIAPNVTASAGFTYDHSSGLFLTGNVAYTGEQFSDVENLSIDAVDDYTIVNARAGYKYQWAEISVFANNVLGDRFITSQNLAQAGTGSGTVTPVGNPFFFVSDPRLFGVELRTRF